jgi:hypothetical protein
LPAIFALALIAKDTINDALMADPAVPVVETYAGVSKVRRCDRATASSAHVRPLASPGVAPSGRSGPDALTE